MKIKRLLEYKDDFCKIFVPRSERPPLNLKVAMHEGAVSHNTPPLKVVIY